MAHGDPRFRSPSPTLIALRGSLVIDGPSGRRQVDADSFFTGFLETALSEEEMLVEVRVPKMPESTWSFQKFNRRAQDWAIVGSAVVINNDSCGVGLVNMDSRPIRASAVEEAISNGASATEASELAQKDVNHRQILMPELTTVVISHEF